MSRKRTAIQAAAVALLITFGPAVSANTSDPLRVFASCAGRLSAQMEHEWLMYDAEAAQTERHRRTMLDLIEALITDQQAAQVLNWRIEAKAAHASLLTRASFRADDWAKDRAAHLVQACTALLIS